MLSACDHCVFDPTRPAYVQMNDHSIKISSTHPIDSNIPSWFSIYSNESTKKRLRSELSTIKHLENEYLETFGDRVYAMTVAANPATLSERDIECFAVDAFFGGCKDRNAAFLAGLRDLPHHKRCCRQG